MSERDKYKPGPNASHINTWQEIHNAFNHSPADTGWITIKSRVVPSHSHLPQARRNASSLGTDESLTTRGLLHRIRDEKHLFCCCNIKGRNSYRGPYAPHILSRSVCFRSRPRLYAVPSFFLHHLEHRFGSSLPVHLYVMKNHAQDVCGGWGFTLREGSSINTRFCDQYHVRYQRPW